MRFAKVASALAIVVCAAVFGVIVLQETFVLGSGALACPGGTCGRASVRR